MKIRTYGLLLMSAIAVGLTPSAALAQAALTLNPGSPAATNPYDTPQSFGWTFTTNSDFFVDGLGHLNASHLGLGASHLLGIFDSSGSLLTTATVPAGTSAPLDGDFRFVDITPLQLHAGNQYTVAGYYTNTDDPVVYAAPVNITARPAINVLNGVYTNPSAGFTFPATSGNSTIFVGPNFRIEQNAPVPEPSLWAVVLAMGAIGFAVRRKGNREGQAARDDAEARRAIP